MKHTKTVAVPAVAAHTKQVHSHTTCDLCGKTIDPERFDADEVEVKHKTGHNYPDCGSGEEVSFDICGDCFDNKVQPWLESQGAKPTVKEWEW